MKRTYTSREFYPWYILYLPIFFQYLYYTCKTKDPLYFYDVNPGMPPDGGILKFSKWNILQHLEPQWKPKTIVYTKGNPFPTKDIIDSLQYPLILKPDNKEKGSDIEILQSYDKVIDTLQKNDNTTLLIQEFIDYQIELAIFWYYLPDEKTGQITGVTTKEFTTVIGDGVKTLAELIQAHPRAHFYEELFMKQYNQEWEAVLPLGAQKQLNNIGNHCKGTLFLDGNELINEKLKQVIQKIVNPLEGFYYGRIDLKTKSLEDLYEGKYIKILEINGAQSEPTHLYDPKHSIRKWYRGLFHHWQVMYTIAIQNRKNGKGHNISFLNHIWEKKKDTTRKLLVAYSENLIDCGDQPTLKNYQIFQQQCTYDCGPANLYALLQYITKDLQASTPTIDTLKKECGITKWWGTNPNRYRSVLNKYCKTWGYKTILHADTDLKLQYKLIKKSLSLGIPVGCLLLVECIKNPLRKGKKTPAGQYGYHFETILGIQHNKETKSEYILLANPFGYEELISKEQFEKRRGLDNKLLGGVGINIHGMINRSIKAMGLTKPYTLFLTIPYTSV